MAPDFPAFVHALPEADLPVEGLRGWLHTGSGSQVLFLEAHAEAIVPEHSHGDQWGIVVAGRLDLTIGGKTSSLAAGDSYVIPAGAPHGARIHAGCRAVDVFADRDRYRARGIEPGR